MCASFKNKLLDFPEGNSKTALYMDIGYTQLHPKGCGMDWKDRSCYDKAIEVAVPFPFHLQNGMQISVCCLEAGESPTYFMPWVRHGPPVATAQDVARGVVECIGR